MKRKAICIGGGGHAKILIEIAQRAQTADIVAVTDNDPSKKGSSLLGVPVAGDDALLGTFLEKGVRAAIIGVGSVKANPVRQKLFDEAVRLGFEMINLIEPSAVVSRSARLGNGVAILPGVIVNAEATIGNNVILYTGAVIEHDVLLRDHVQVSPGAIVAGGAEVGEGSFLGAGCCIIQGVKIGRGVTVGAGSVVLQDVPDGATVVGVPARPIVSVVGR